MIPVSNKTRSVTRVRYTHASFWRQEKCDNNSYASRTALRAELSRFVCSASVSDADLKTRRIVELSREETIETKPAAMLVHQPPRRRHHPHRPHRPHRFRPRYLCRIQD
jgi:hypothetical protein